MADPNDNLDEEMMDIIDTGSRYVGDDNQDADDGSQYLNLENEPDNNEDDNAGGEVYA